MTAQDLGCIQSSFLKLTPECDLNSPLVFVLDEIHKIKGWEDYVIHPAARRVGELPLPMPRDCRRLYSD